jgi:hypothetical protein
MWESALGVGSVARGHSRRDHSMVQLSTVSVYHIGKNKEQINMLRLIYITAWIRCIGLWRRYVTIKILDINHRLGFYLWHGGLDTESLLHLQVKPTELGKIDRASLCRFRAQMSRFCLKTETESSLWSFVCWWIMSRIVIVILIYRRHKPIDSINLLGS